MAPLSWRGHRVRYLVLALLLLAAGLVLTGAGSVPYGRAGGLHTGGDTESLTQLQHPPATFAGPLRVVFRVPVAERAVFLTIDDGWFPDRTVLGLMQKYHLPVTAFLIEKAMREHPAYWQAFVQAGGHIGDHTYDHPFLTHLTPAAQATEIGGPLDYYSRFVPRPDELRPPYGDYNAAVGAAARKAGIRYVVMWDAEMNGGHLHTIRNRPLEPGDIILLHWVPGLGKEMASLLAVLQQEKLGVADLTQALAGGPLTVIQVPASAAGLGPPAPVRSVAGQVYEKGGK